ncbi:hypothetical protein CFT12S02847_07525 [Campylobacter fetus subsp. testudinum]|uniref:hypothetical protein n=2 Tax=Campylobacter fetus TaxID=196 RepID=UPI000818B603|nr:hypothetical protein [Campylobacter fetus]OCR95653.1 hypothetical protein CFT12S02847_07525 [Campylobacter fetus subsp. testudinum]
MKFEKLDDPIFTNHPKEIELPFKIVVKNIDSLSENNKKVINLGTYENEEVKKLLNTLKMIDILEQQHAMEKVEFSNEYIEFSIVTKEKEIPLNIKLGEGNFTKGIEHLIKIGSLGLKDIEINPIVKENLNKFLNKKIDKQILDNLLDGGLKSVEAITETMDKNLFSFIAEFSKTYNKTVKNDKEKRAEKGKFKQELKDNSEVNKEKQTKGKTKDYFVNKFNDFFKKKFSTKQIDKERTNEKSLSKSIH